ncbi:MAG: glycosyltransferase [Lachnospiraceae bacterium]|nr:glycosyltransferase [Lachnospiraceae bacterium]
MAKLPISVCMIAKNEEKYIEDCLSRLKRYGFEIIVTDTGSTDKTKQLAQEYADKVLDFEWINDFSAARNYCAQAASNQWILALDCDEMLESFDEKAVRTMMQKYPMDKGMLHFKLMLQNAEGEECFEWDKLVRLYNKKYYEFQGTIHEQIVPKKGFDAGSHTPAGIILPVNIVHLGYNISGEEMAKKQQRNIELLKGCVEKEPENSYLWFQLGQSHFIIRDFEHAVLYYEKALELLGERFSAGHAQELVISLSKAYASLERYEETLDILLRHAPYFKSAKYAYATALAYVENNALMKALLEFIKIIALPDAEALGSDLETCYGCISDLYRQFGDEKMAQFFIEKRRERFHS